MRTYIKNFAKPVILLLVLLVSGTIGFRTLEGWDTVDSLYMTLITLSTVGFGEVHPLGDNGKIFTMFLLAGGVIFYAITINSIASNIMETSFGALMNELKTTRKISRLKDHYIICGGGRMAFTIGKEMEKNRETFVFIENNAISVVAEYDAEWPLIQKDALLEETLIEAGIERAKGLAAVLPTDADNLFVVLSARRLNPNLFIQTRVSMESTLSKMLQAGADRVVSPYTVGGLQIARTFLNPHIDDFLSVVTDRASYEFEMNITRVHADVPFCNKKIRETSFSKEGFMIIGVRLPDGTMKFAPPADFILTEGSEIFLLGPGKTESV